MRRLASYKVTAGLACLSFSFLNLLSFMSKVFRAKFVVCFRKPINSLQFRSIKLQMFRNLSCLKVIVIVCKIASLYFTHFAMALRCKSNKIITRCYTLRNLSLFLNKRPLKFPFPDFSMTTESVLALSHFGALLYFLSNGLTYKSILGFSTHQLIRFFSFL